MRIEQTILSNLIYTEDYTRRVLPFLKSEYFQDQVESVLFKEIDDFITKYNGLPTKETLLIELNKKENIPEQVYENLTVYVNDISFEKKDMQWLIDSTEEFCQERAVYNAIMESISIIEGRSKTADKGGIPTILADALGVSFDDHIGHDFLENADERYEFYNAVEDRIPFDIEHFNLITKGGLPNKTLNVLLAGTGVGKTLAMCHMAAANLLDGKNVLYITLEMAEERIAERIDSNLLNIPLDELKGFPKQIYDDKIVKLKKKTGGKIIVKEYPTATVGSGHFRHLLNELSMKKNFSADIIYIDYINLCQSTRLKFGANVNSYSYIKAVAEELRGLAVEKNVPRFQVVVDDGLDAFGEALGIGRVEVPQPREHLQQDGQVHGYLTRHLASPEVQPHAEGGEVVSEEGVLIKGWRGCICGVAMISLNGIGSRSGGRLPDP